MKKWMILAAAILVVLGIGFAVKGASDRKLTVQPSETALPEATAEPEQAALTDETQTEDGMTQVYMLHGQITEITDEYLMLEGTEQGTVQVNLLDEESIRAILAHGWSLRTDVEPLTEMEKSLFTVDELTGLVAATARMRPGGLSDLEPSSVKKKFKDKKFAAKIDRPLIQKGCDMLGMELTDVMALCIEGMREHMDELGLGPKA